MLRDLVVAGRARPRAVVTNHGTLDDAPDFFKIFDRRADGIVKAVLRPN
jgi:glutathione-independent formaldehyde dehydrogenase